MDPNQNVEKTLEKNLEKTVAGISRMAGTEQRRDHSPIISRGYNPPDEIPPPVKRDAGETSPLSPTDLKKEIADLSRLSAAINEKVGEFIVGNHEIIDLILIALLNEGHILVEGIPGTGKTTIAKTVSLLTGCSFNRIQGAIDIQPADMLGVRIYDTVKKDFVLKKGPIFTNFLLVDEINRINPKSQSAFIEAMSERQVTLDGITLPMQSPFFVIATQNPHEFEGTFPLIEVQRDRFMFSIRSDYVSADEELNIIKRVHAGQLRWELYSRTITPLLNPHSLRHYINVVRQVIIEDPVLQYIRDLVVSTRTHPDIELGASSRASISLVAGAKTMAALNNRAYVLPDDVKNIARAALAHRLVISRDAEIEGLTRNQIMDEILAKVEVL